MATTFVWKGRTPAGEDVSGEYEADNKIELASHLRKKKIILTQVRQKPKDLNINFGFKQKIGIKDLGIFTRQFATMINAGLPLVQCLDILSSQIEKDNFREIVTEVMEDVESGSTLSEALSKHKCFSELFVNMVDAGESGGILDLILNRLALFLEKQDSLRRKIKGALTYPTIVLFVAGGATIFMLMFIIPTFAKMFIDFGGDLPLPTQIVMGLSNFLRVNWYLLLGAGIGIYFGIKKYNSTDNGKRRIDRFLLNLPILGTVIRKGAVAMFTRTLGTLTASGVPIIDGLNITAKTAGNKVIEDAVVKTRESIREGNTIAEPLKQSGVFPPMVVQMISVGEQTGALDEMLEKIADFYDEEVDGAVDALTSAIEPIMIVVMGVIVGGMLISMYLPMFKLISVVSGG
ncbi:MAG: type II secretion system F family protein [Candidatus Krumholzibacteriota bacterium]|nr:type II secretion system F family protein [Candidatus Krumholzibacteriota bacterium]